MDAPFVRTRSAHDFGGALTDWELTPSTDWAESPAFPPLTWTAVSAALTRLFALDRSAPLTTPELALIEVRLEGRGFRETCGMAGTTGIIAMFGRPEALILELLC